MRTIDRFVGKYNFLSSTYPSSVEIGGITYPTVCHAIIASKIDSIEIKKQIAALNGLGQVFRFEKTLEESPEWIACRRDVMKNILRKKFSDPKLMHALKETDSAYLINTNYWGETYWGCCDGYGKNVLGHLLMEIRNGK